MRKQDKKLIKLINFVIHVYLENPKNGHFQMNISPLSIKTDFGIGDLSEEDVQFLNRNISKYSLFRFIFTKDSAGLTVRQAGEV